MACAVIYPDLGCFFSVKLCINLPDGKIITGIETPSFLLAKGNFQM